MTITRGGTPLLPPAFNWPAAEDVRRVRLSDPSAGIFDDEGRPVYAAGGDAVCVPGWQAAELVARGLGERVVR